MAATGITLTPIRSNLSIRMNFVLFPIDSINLLNTMAGQGFVPIPQRRNIPEAPLGIRIEVSGIIAGRGQVSVGLDGNSQLISAFGPNPQEVAIAFNDVIRIIRQDLGIDIDMNTRFYECTSTIHARSGSNPLQTLNNIECGETIGRLGTILNLDVRTYALHIGSPSDTVNRPDWFDMYIRPESYRSNTTYEIITVFRRQVMNEVVEFLTGIEERVRDIIVNIDNR